MANVAEDEIRTNAFRSSIMQVDETWLDYNGHLNMAFYNVLFDRAIDELVTAFGLGPDYLKATKCSFFTAETHVTYLRELEAGDRVHVDIMVLDCDAKRLHVFEELYHADHGFRSATLEQILLHVDMEAKKVTPWPCKVSRRLQAQKEAHQALPRPSEIGHQIGIKSRR